MKRITIVADDREQKSRVVKILQESERFTLRMSRLPSGDYCVDNRFLFERKTLADLVVSIKSGRLFSQALRLIETENLRPALILEGTSQDLRNSCMQWGAIQGALVTLTLFLRLPVLRTRTAEETVKTFLYASMQGRNVVQGSLPRHGRRPRGKDALQRYILQGLPGVGPVRAAQLIEHFGNVHEALTADKSELSEVPGIGKQLAQQICWAVREKRVTY